MSRNATVIYSHSCSKHIFRDSKRSVYPCKVTVDPTEWFVIDNNIYLWVDIAFTGISAGIKKKAIDTMSILNRSYSITMPLC